MSVDLKTDYHHLSSNPKPRNPSNTIPFRNTLKIPPAPPKDADIDPIGDPFQCPHRWCVVSPKPASAEAGEGGDAALVLGLLRRGARGQRVELLQFGPELGGHDLRIGDL